MKLGLTWSKKYSSFTGRNSLPTALLFLSTPNVTDNETTSFPFGIYVQGRFPSIQITKMFPKGWGILCPCPTVIDLNAENLDAFVRQQKMYTEKHRICGGNNKLRKKLPEF